MTQADKTTDEALSDDTAAPEVSTDSATAADPVASLQAELERMTAKAEENRSLYMEARAEIDNLRKRAERDLANAHKYALEKFVNELLPVKDSLEMGLAAVNGGADMDKLREGKELTLKMLVSALHKFGVREIDPRGEKFNPDLHEAMAMQPSNQAAPNTVVQVVQKGYLLNERLVRPAMVIVARADPSAAER